MICSSVVNRVTAVCIFYRMRCLRQHSMCYNADCCCSMLAIISALHHTAHWVAALSRTLSIPQCGVTALCLVMRIVSWYTV